MRSSEPELCWGFFACEGFHSAVPSVRICRCSGMYVPDCRHDAANPSPKSTQAIGFHSPPAGPDALGRPFCCEGDLH